MTCKGTELCALLGPLLGERCLSNTISENFIMLETSWNHLILTTTLKEVDSFPLYRLFSGLARWLGEFRVLAEQT